jgi:mercuric reductase
MHLVRDRAAAFGVRGVEPDALWFDLPATVARKDQIIQGIIDGIYGWVNKDENITFIRGRAEFTSPVDIRVDGQVITAQKSIIATGSRTADVRIPGLAEVGFITNYEALSGLSLPRCIVVLVLALLY